VIDYRLASAINPPASLSTNLRLHWCFDLRLCPESFSDLRRRSTRGGASYQPPTSPEIASSVSPSDQPPTFAGCRVLQSSFRTNFQSFIGHLVFQLTFQPTSDSRRILHRPVLPSNPTSRFRWPPHPPAFLSDRPPTCAGYRILQFCLPTNFRLIIGYRVSDFAFRSASDLRQRSIFQLCPPIQPPACAGC